MIQLKGQYELSDFKAAQGLHARLGQRWAVLIVALVLVAFGALILIPQGEPASWWALVPVITFVAVWALVEYAVLPRRIAHVFTQQKDLSQPFEMELSDEGFQIKNDYGSSRVPWKDFIKWKENKELFLLYRSDYSFNMLPKRFFQNETEIEYVREKLQAHAVPAASQVRNLGSMGLAVILLIVVVAVVIVSFLTHLTP